MRIFYLIFAVVICGFGVLVGIPLIFTPSQPVTLIIDNPQFIHVGDLFNLNVKVYNSGFVPIKFANFHISNDFDRNAIAFQYSGCSSIGEDFSIEPFQSMTIQVPNIESCHADLANSTGHADGIVQLNYTINGIARNVNATTTFDILSTPDDKLVIRPFDVYLNGVYTHVHLNFKKK